MITSKHLFLNSKIHIITYAILLAYFLGAFQASIIQLALPNISNEFGVNYASLSLVIAIYFLTFSTFSVSLGKLGDIYTPKVVFLAGLAFFGVASWFSSISHSPFSLMIFRALQGIGIGAMSANGISLLRITYPEERRGHALALWSATVSLGYIIGPSIGGYIVTFYGWRPLFRWTLALDVVLFVILVFVLPTSTRRKTNFDYWGAILLAMAMLSFILVIRPPKGSNFGLTTTLLLALMFLITMIFFIVYERKLKSPLIDFQMFVNKIFRYGLLIGMILAATIQGINYLLQYYLQHDLGYSASDSGLFWTIMSVATLLATILFGRRSDQVGSRVLIIYGSMLRFFSFVLLFATFYSHQFTTLLVAIVVTLFGLGMGMSSAPINSLIVGAFPRSETGTVSGIYSMLRTLAGSVGVILFGWLLLAGEKSIQMSLGIPVLVAILLTLIGLGIVYRVPRGS